MKLLQKKSFLEAIKNSIGSKIFRNFYVEENGKERDILEDGKLSCAFFVSSILKQFNMIDEIHTTVDGLLKDLGKDWQEVSVLEASAGDILVWEKEGQYGHIGFALDEEKAISNSTKKRVPHIHSQDFDGTRLVSKVFSLFKIS
jgi:hypothetical protein